MRSTYLKILKDNKIKRNSIVHKKARPAFNILEYSSSEDKLFRFTPAQLSLLVVLLGIPDFRTRSRVRCKAIEALAILCRRLSFSNRWVDLFNLFHRHPSELSEIFHLILDFLYDRYAKPLLVDFNERLLNMYIWQCNESISRKVKSRTNVFGFVDGTSVAICRPGLAQELFWSGHKHCHCLKFNCIFLPNGLCLNVSLPYEGRHGDAYMVKTSDYYTKLESYLASKNLVLFSDLGYGQGNVIVNKSLLESKDLVYLMDRTRVSVEWGFSIVKMTWESMHNPDMLKIGLHQ